MTPFYRFSHCTCRLIGLLGFGFRAYGSEHVPRSGGAIIASNHQSFFDPVLLGMGQGRPLRYFARRTLFRNPAFALLIRSLGAIEFGRDTVDSAAIRRMIKVLQEGALVVMFPEGTRTRDGSIGRVKPGVDFIARRSGVPVVPAVIDGAYKSWPRSHLLPKLSRISVAYGKPIEASEAGDRKMQHKLQERLEDLLVFLRNKQ